MEDSLIENKVTIIVPVYNNDLYIEKCIKSLFNQSYKNIEIVAVDDGSTDRSGEILDRLARNDIRLRCEHQTNKGVSAARNRGLNLSTGKYITFVDGDDYVDATYIEDLITCAVENNSDMVLTGLKMVDESGVVLKSIVPQIYKKYVHEEWTFRVGAVAAHLYKRQMWEDYHINFYEGERGEDMPISLFFSAMCQSISVVPESKYNYLQHSKSVMHSFGKVNHFQMPYQALEEMIKKIQELGVKNSSAFHEYYILRIMLTMITLSKNCDTTQMECLEKYIYYILQKYYPDYASNEFLGIFSKLQIPTSQKVAVRALVFFVKKKHLKWLLKILC